MALNNVFSTRMLQEAVKKRDLDEEYTRKITAKKNIKIKKDLLKIIEKCEFEAYAGNNHIRCSQDWIDSYFHLEMEYGLVVEKRSDGAKPIPLNTQFENMLSLGYVIANEVASLIGKGKINQFSNGSAEKKAEILMESLNELRGNMKNLSAVAESMSDPKLLREVASELDDFILKYEIKTLKNNHAEYLKKNLMTYDVLSWSSVSDGFDGVMKKKLNWLATKSENFLRALDSHIISTIKKNGRSNTVQIIKVEDILKIGDSEVKIPKYVELDWLFDLINRISGYGYEWYPKTKSSDESITVIW